MIDPTPRNLSLFQLPSTIPLDDLPVEERETVEALNRAILALCGYYADFRAVLGLYDFAQKTFQETIERLKRSLDPSMPDSQDSHDSLYWQNIADYYQRWMLSASRDAALTLSHFSSTIEDVRKNLRHAPTFLSKTNTEKLRDTEKLFASYFPRAMRVRHGVAHRAHEATLRPKPSRKSAVDMPPNVMVMNARMIGCYVEGSVANVAATDSYINESVGGLSSQDNTVSEGNLFSVTHGGETVSFRISLNAVEQLEKVLIKFLSAFNMLPKLSEGHFSRPYQG